MIFDKIPETHYLHKSLPVTQKGIDKHFFLTYRAVKTVRGKMTVSLCLFRDQGAI
jgi:hypothetical protein